MYHYKASSKSFDDITFNNREISLDPSDPGGRLGPFDKTAAPDLRNLDLYSTNCEKGDIIIGVSDGVHDNLDPELLGILPSELYLPFSSWNDIPIQISSVVKTKFSLRLLQILLFESDSGRIETTNKLTATHCVHTLINHAQRTTKNTRDWTEQNPRIRLPEDYVRYPGKVDHTTCIAVEVGSSYQGISSVFENSQIQLNSMQKKFEEKFRTQQSQIERQFFSLNIPLQVTICSSDIHVILFCRTFSNATLSVLHEEHRVYIKVIGCCFGLENLIDEKKLSGITIHGSDELSYPIERIIELPYPIEVFDDPPSMTITVDPITQLITVKLLRKKKKKQKRMPAIVSISTVVSDGNLGTSSDPNSSSGRRRAELSATQ